MADKAFCLKSATVLHATTTTTTATTSSFHLTGILSGVTGDRAGCYKRQCLGIIEADFSTLGAVPVSQLKLLLETLCQEGDKRARK